MRKPEFSGVRARSEKKREGESTTEVERRRLGACQTPSSCEAKHPVGCFFVGTGREDKFLIIPVLSSAFFYKVCYNRGENDLGACQYESASLWMAAFDIHSR